jgi:hypothetical protein
MASTFSVLVIANVTATSPELSAALRERAAENSCRFTLVVPAARGPAGRARVEEAVAHLRDEGLSVDGLLGDHDPTAAFHDVWDPAVFDEIVVSTLPTGPSRWLQVDLPHRIERATGVPVRHIVATGEAANQRA